MSNILAAEPQFDVPPLLAELFMESFPVLAFDVVPVAYTQDAADDRQCAKDNDEGYTAGDHPGELFELGVLVSGR